MSLDRCLFALILLGSLAGCTAQGDKQPSSTAEILQGLQKYHPTFDDSRSGTPVFVSRLALTHKDGSKDFFRIECLPDDPDITISPFDGEDDKFAGDSVKVTSLRPNIQH